MVVYSLLFIDAYPCMGGMPCEKIRTPVLYLSYPPRIACCIPCFCGNRDLPPGLFLPAPGRSQEDFRAGLLPGEAGRLRVRHAEEREVLLREPGYDSSRATAGHHREAVCPRDHRDPAAAGLPAGVHLPEHR